MAGCPRESVQVRHRQQVRAMLSKRGIHSFKVRLITRGVRTDATWIASQRAADRVDQRADVSAVAAAGVAGTDR
ncbi:hypothetical protein MRX96_012983 [Rhipicephalus microplus]